MAPTPGSRVAALWLVLLSGCINLGPPKEYDAIGRRLIELTKAHDWTSGDWRVLPAWFTLFGGGILKSGPVA